MAWLLTDFGAEYFLNRATGLWSETEGPHKKNMHLLGSAPPLDRSRVLKSQYTLIVDCDPDHHSLGPEATTLATIFGGRAVAQYGPPAYTYTALAGITVYGIVIVTEGAKVLWFDRFATPVPLLVGQTIQVLPAIRATSECPPLGGC
jgi:hypothetical protein